MEEEIDLREYVKVLLRWWKLIGGVTLAAVVVAAVVSLLQPTIYEAAATVVGKKPAQPTELTLAQMALEDDLLAGLWGQLQPVKGAETMAALRGMLRATAGADGSTVQLSVRAGDAQEAARIANGWAEALAPYASARYREAAKKEMNLLEGQAKQAQARLDEAQRALAEFQGRSQVTILEARRASAEQDLRDSLAEQREVERLLEKAQALRAQLAGQPSDARVRLTDGLAALALQAQAAGARATGLSQVPLQLQLSEAAISSVGQTAGEATAFLDGLTTALNDQSKRISARIAGLEPQLLTLQQQVQEGTAERDNLMRARDAALQTYQPLALKVENARLASTVDEARVTGPAAVPGQPSGRNKLFNVAVAGVLGLMLGAFGAFAIEWWRGGAQGEG